MIEINLLPEEMRKKPSVLSGFNFKEVDFKSIPIIKIAVGIGAAVALIQALTIVVGVVSSFQLNATNKKYTAIIPKKSEADVLKAKVAEINKRSGAIDELIVKRFSWAKKVSQLNDCIVQGVWLSELSYDELKVVDPKARHRMAGALTLSGYAAGTGDQGAIIIGKFIRSLQDNKEFSQDMLKVDLVSSKSAKVENQDVMSFTVSCRFK